MWGANAYAIACQRADEASSEGMSADWGHVAATIAHKTGQRSSLLSYVFH